MRRTPILVLALAVLGAAAFGAGPAAIGATQDGGEFPVPGDGVSGEKLFEAPGFPDSAYDVEIYRFQFDLPFANFPPKADDIVEPVLILVSEGLFEFTIEPQAEFETGDVIVDPAPGTSIEVDGTECEAECAVPSYSEDGMDFRLEPGSWVAIRGGAPPFCYLCYLEDRGGVLLVHAYPSQGDDFSWTSYAGGQASADPPVSSVSRKSATGLLNPGCQGRRQVR